MNFSCRQVLLVSLLLIILINYSTAASARKICVFKCLKAVIKCKRDVNVGIRKNVDCCAEYKDCYKICDPSKIPGCTNQRKRGSWNKRAEVSRRDMEEPVFPIFTRDVIPEDNDFDTDWDIVDSLLP